MRGSGRGYSPHRLHPRHPGARGRGFSAINPITALYWSAVVNGAVAVPIMVLLMIMTARRRVIGDFTIGIGLEIFGWAATTLCFGR